MSVPRACWWFEYGCKFFGLGAERKVELDHKPAITGFLAGKNRRLDMVLVQPATHGCHNLCEISIMECKPDSVHHRLSLTSGDAML